MKIRMNQHNVISISADNPPKIINLDALKSLYDEVNNIKGEVEIRLSKTSFTAIFKPLIKQLKDVADSDKNFQLITNYKLITKDDIPPKEELLKMKFFYFLDQFGYHSNQDVRIRNAIVRACGEHVTVEEILKLHPGQILRMKQIGRSTLSYIEQLFSATGLRWLYLEE